MIRQVLVLILALTGVSANAQKTDGSVPKADTTVFSEIVEISRQRLWQELLTGDIVANVGKEFVGSPYVPFSLEEPGKEHLVVNLRGFDCVTLVENVLAITRCIQWENTSFQSYRDMLRTIRYRGGVLDGYPSRLHYFSEWLDDNARKGFVRDITRDLGGVQLVKRIDWMTKHRQAYRQLRDSTTFARVAGVEKLLSESPRWYIASDSIQQIESGLQNGDIVAAVSSKDGLDIAHTGIAVRMDDGSVRYLHAPDVKGSVKISDESLHEYMKKHPAFSGIIVARPIGEKQNEK